MSETPEKRKPGRPISRSKPISKSSQIGTKENESRVTFVVDDISIEKVRAIAYWKRVTIKEVVNEALTSTIDKYEAEEGPVQPIPQK